MHEGGDVIIVFMMCAVLCAGTPGVADGWWHTKEPPPFTPSGGGSEGRLVLLPAHLGLVVCPDRQPAEEEMGLGGVRGCWLV